jgi:hypothetical protein
MYIADNGNHRVQKWLPATAQGITVAGGNGLGAGSSQLSYPGAVYVDPSGNVYVADNSNHRIQKWTPGATVGITIAGGNDRGDAANQLNYPHALFVSKNGEVFVGDDNAKIQKWTPGATSGITVAGTGVGGNALSQINSTSGLFVDPSNALYISDPTNARVQKWPAGATEGITIAGGNGAGSNPNQFSYQSGIAVDVDGNLYIADNNNHRIQKYNQQISNQYIPASSGAYHAEITYFNGCVVTSNSINVYPATVPTAKLEYNSFQVNCMNETPVFTLVSNQTLIQPTYEWYKNNALISGQVAASYYGRDLLENDSLKCRVTFSNGGCLPATTVTTPAFVFSRNKQFTFTGTGNWSQASNWLNGKMPPDPIPCCTKILIDPAVNGECVVASAVRIPSCVDFSIAGNKKLRVLGNLVNKYDSTVILNENVRLPENNNGVIVSTAQELNQGVYKFNFTSTPSANYSPGNILIGASNNGYIRKVTSATVQGNTIVCQTTQGNMEDVFKQGKISFSGNTDSDLQAAAGYNYLFNDVILYQNGPLSIKLKNGSISLDPNWDFDFEYKNSKFKYFKAGFQNALLNSNFQIEVNASQSTTLFDQADTLKRLSKQFIHWVPVFGIPIPVVVEMNLDFICKYSAAVNASIQRTVDFTSSSNMTMSLEFINNAWNPVYALNTNKNVKMSASEGAAGINVEMAIVPTFSFQLYNIDGPYTSIGLHEIFEGNVASPSLNWDFSAGAFLKTTIGCKTSVMGVNLVDYEREWNTDTIFYKTPYKLEKTSGDNQVGNPNQQFTNPINVRVLDQKNSPQSNVPVYFVVTSGGGAVQEAKVFTNSTGYAQTYWTAGSGASPNVIQVSVKDHADANISGSPLTFNANLANPNSLVKISGDNQTAPPGQTLTNTLKVRVFDVNNVPLSNIPVSFTVTNGGGGIPGSVFTNADGYAEANWTLGQTSEATQKVSVSVKNNNGVDVIGSPAVFNATLRKDSIQSVSIAGWSNIDNVCAGYARSGNASMRANFKNAAPPLGTLWSRTSWDGDEDGIIDGYGSWSSRDMSTLPISGNTASFDNGFCWGRVTGYLYFEVFYKSEGGTYQSNTIKIFVPRP